MDIAFSIMVTKNVNVRNIFMESIANTTTEKETITNTGTTTAILTKNKCNDFCISFIVSP